METVEDHSKVIVSSRFSSSPSDGCSPTEFAASQVVPLVHDNSCHCVFTRISFAECCSCCCILYTLAYWLNANHSKFTHTVVLHHNHHHHRPAQRPVSTAFLNRYRIRDKAVVFTTFGRIQRLPPPPSPVPTWTA